MKNIQFILAVIFVTVLINACDYVHPNKKSAPVGPAGTICTTDSAITTSKQVLVEDYTGHTCGNCPYAAYELDSPIIYTYHNRVVPIAVHAGSFANPGNAPYTSDYRTSVGNAWDALTGFNMSNGWGNPIGMIDREGCPSNNGIYKTAWKDSVTNILNTVPNLINLKIVNYYSCSSRIDSTAVIANYLQALSNTYMLSVVLIEDSIIDNQEIYVPEGSNNAQLITGYVFNHMLRGSFNGVFGDNLSRGAQLTNATFTKTYKDSISASFIPKNCKVVAFVYDSATYRVIQAVEAPVTH